MIFLSTHALIKKAKLEQWLKATLGKVEID